MKIGDRQVVEGQEREFINREVIPALRGLQDGASIEREYRIPATTTTGAYVRIWESPEAPTIGCWFIQFRVAGAGAADACVYAREATYQISVSGGIALIGAISTILERESSAAADVRFGVDTDTRKVYVEAIDAGTDMSWEGKVKVLEVVAA